VSRRPIPDDFGRAYRRAVFALTPRSTAALVLEQVLLDEAYRRRSTTFELGYSLLRELTQLDGRSLERGRDWLVEHGLLVVRSTPRVRTEWELVLPADLSASWGRTDSHRASDRASDRTSNRTSVRPPGADALPGPLPLPLPRARRTDGETRPEDYNLPTLTVGDDREATSLDEYTQA
jgi:hypothetical protein